MSLDAIDPQMQRLAKERREACVNEAIFAGVKGGAMGLSVAGGAVYLLNKYNDVFRGKFNTSAKAAFVVSSRFPSVHLLQAPESSTS
jgi:hypothetical protein